MREPVFTGACTAIVTPFDQSGAIDYGCFGRLIDQQLDHGVDAICVCGTTGESATLSIREHIAAVEYCVKRVDHRVKVIAGAGSNDTTAAVYLSLHAQDSGADALLHVTPYYNKCSQTGLIKHYEYIADRVDLPVILYNVQRRLLHGGDLSGAVSEPQDQRRQGGQWKLLPPGPHPPPVRR